MKCVDAVVEIVEILRGEGLNSIAFDVDDARRLRDELRLFLSQDLEINKALLLYHILVLKTGGEGVWTMARDPGEMRVEGYLPNILDACGLPMSAEICSSDGDFSLSQGEALGEDVTRLLTAEEADEESENSPCTEDWQESPQLCQFVTATRQGCYLKRFKQSVTGSSSNLQGQGVDLEESCRFQQSQWRQCV